MKPGRALVTGAAQRLGRSMALALAEDGWDIAVHYNGNLDKAEETADHIRALGRTAVTLQCDLDDPESTGALVTAASDGLGGPLNVLINNASFHSP